MTRRTDIEPAGITGFERATTERVAALQADLDDLAAKVDDAQRRAQRRTRWTVDSATGDKLDHRLGFGWEPFAVTTDDDGTSRVWLRKERRL